MNLIDKFILFFGQSYQYLYLILRFNLDTITPLNPTRYFYMILRNKPYRIIILAEQYVKTLRKRDRFIYYKVYCWSRSKATNVLR